ncbi:MAG: hypothetical protein ACOC0R_03605, partial [Mariniphaga sp.]
MIRVTLFLLVFLLTGTVSFPQNLNNEYPEMDAFINELMAKMTVEEKIGQLNLITPGGGIPTGEAVSTDVEGKIKAGNVGGIFGVYGPELVRKAQQLAVEHTRHGIPMLFGADVIH